MNALDSPIEALALNYLSYGILTAVNNIWAWLAVITAAISLWRIRALSSPFASRSEQRVSCQDIALMSLSPRNVSAADAIDPATVSTPAETRQYLLSYSTTTTKTSGCVLESKGSPKVKFNLYYNQREFVESDDEGEDECSDGGNGGGAVARGKLGWWHTDSWERVMVVRMGDMGWYKCQDLMVLDGSVVQLWDGRRRQRCADTLVADSGGGGVGW